MRPGAAKRARLATTALAVVISLTACSGDDDDDASEPESPTTPTSAPPVVSSKVSVGEVTGRLPRKKREAVSDDVGKVVTGWIEAAYFDGSPRTGLAGAFPGFTRGAEQLARRDKWLMSNASLASNVDEVVPVGDVRVNVDMLAVKERVAGATARFKIVFDAVAGRTKRVTVRGRVMLTRNDKGKWRIFAYDADRWAKAQKGARS